MKQSNELEVTTLVKIPLSMVAGNATVSTTQTPQVTTPSEPIPEAIPEAENYTDEPVKSPGFETILFRGERYSFTPQQRVVVAALWEAWEKGEPFCSHASLLELCDTASNKLSQVFARCTAWGTIILRGGPFGGPADSYCLSWAVNS